MLARDKTKENIPPQPVNILDIEVGDLCQFKGTRNKGFRRIMEINRKEYFCRVVTFKKGVVEMTNFTSSNSKEKLDKVYRNGQWVRIIRDSLSK